MNNQVSAGGKGIWNGWYWRFVGSVVVVVAILEIVAFYVTKGGYPLISTGELGMFMSAILIVQRAKQRRTANTLLAVLLLLVINLVLQLTIGYAYTKHMGWGGFIQQNLIIGAIGVLFSVVYARTTAWSDKKRKDAEAKRRETQAAKGNAEEQPQTRVHRVKKKRGRGKRA
ncbi:hypothetical protein [Alicyclobacillus dauci]|uniref:4 TMS phage holin, superfamily IV n=1 Tax=Alicyclobacillus dauci TaxID=1475485 RepID=A0ABY6Z8B9_9BACL|nr:hypothetical protein [Alicyclobacillus dauci]WAH38953.1 hypothetical protein NZD86_10975 [Alicyclobacillus dauci]